MVKSKKNIQFIQMVTFVLFVAFLVMNRFASGVPDFVQGLMLGVSVTGFVFILLNYKLLKENSVR